MPHGLFLRMSIHSGRGSAGSDRCRCADCWLAWFCVVSALLLTGAVHAWGRSQNHDEKTYYLPAIERAAGRLPHFAIDYKLPAPPLPLILQAAVYRITGSVAAVRGLSTAFAAAAAGLLYLLVCKTVPSGKLRVLIPAALVCFPFSLAWAYRLRPHSMALFFLLLAFVLLRALEARPTARSGAALGLSLGCAVLSSQFTVPMVVGIGGAALLAPGDRMRRAAFVFTMPLAMLTLLFTAWHGFQPPSYRAAVGLLESKVGLGYFRPIHVVAAFQALGTWLAPVTFSRRQKLNVGLLLGAWLLFGSVVFLAKPYAGEPFFDTIRGPFATVVRAIPSSVAQAIFVGFVCALGLGALLSMREQRVEEGWKGDWAAQYLGIALFLLMMNMIPYYFEAYYTYLVLPCLWFAVIRARRSMEQPLEHPVRFLYFVAVGVIYFELSGAQ